MVENLKHNGIVFNMNDDQSFVDDLLNADLGETLQVTENPEPTSDKTFEDED